MAEWSKAIDCKSIDCSIFGGSNPSSFNNCPEVVSIIDFTRTSGPLTFTIYLTRSAIEHVIYRYDCTIIKVYNTNMEEWLSGLKQRFAKPSRGLIIPPRVRISFLPNIIKRYSSVGRTVES